MLEHQRNLSQCWWSLEGEEEGKGRGRGGEGEGEGEGKGGEGGGRGEGEGKGAVMQSKWTPKVLYLLLWGTILIYTQ